MLDSTQTNGTSINVVAADCLKSAQPDGWPDSRRLEWIMIPGDPLIYAGKDFTMCLAVEDLQASSVNGLRDPLRLNIFTAQCNASSELQRWTFDPATGRLALQSSVFAGFAMGKGRRCCLATGRQQPVCFIISLYKNWIADWMDCE